MSVENSTQIEHQWWFIPLDILMIFLSLSGIIISIIFLLILIFDRTCHTLVMLFVFNSCLASFINGCNLFGMSILTFHNDIKQILYEDLLCNARGYILYSGYSLLNYSYLVQSLYRYVTVVYPRNFIFRTFRFQIFLISLTWLFSFLYPIGCVLTDGFHYNSDNQICLLRFRLSFSIIYGALCAYTIPMFIYIKLVRYVHQMGKRVTSINVLNRAKREVRMTQRTIILLSILISLGVPFLIFIIISFFQIPPKYHIRIPLIFVNISMLLVMIVLYVFTEQFKTFLMKIRNLVTVATLR